MGRMMFNDGWLLREEMLSCGPDKAALVAAKTDGWHDCTLPCDVHQPLIESGIIKEPLEAENTKLCRWIEDRSWWFKKCFDANDAILEDDSAELVFESLDSEADIFLNGIHIGHQRSAFYPFSMDVKEYLRPGANTLLVRLTSGLEYFSENDLAGHGEYVNTEIKGDRSSDRGDERRAFVRKPQFVYGWDWSPRLATCGIVKGAWLETFNLIAIRSAAVVTKGVEKKDGGYKASVEIEVETESFHPVSSFEASLYVSLRYDGIKVAEAEKEYLLLSGVNYSKFRFDLDDAKLWWPNGYGAQNLYSVHIKARCGNNVYAYPEFKCGVRTVKLVLDKLLPEGTGKPGLSDITDTADKLGQSPEGSVKPKQLRQPKQWEEPEKIDQQERLFAIEVNGEKIMCKGGNWAPADAIYARVTDEKYDMLIREARDANFTMLLLWGGGLYEKDVFYEKCDQYGIMLWQDFMFACSLFPESVDWFMRDVEKEIEYQTRRLRNHPSIVIWCGNNETHWIFADRWKPSVHHGFDIYNYLAPRIVRRNCPDVPYWNGSPYGGMFPNDNEVGDRHHWFECTMNPEMAKRIAPEEYDKVTSKFISEYGYIGPCRKSTIKKYFGGNPIDRSGSIWQHHNNTFERAVVLAGIERHYADPAPKDLDMYLLYAGLCQGLMLGYSLEAIRSKPNCWGSIFWMYNDCWGEVGWTIEDYYLKRKTAYYFVKRAFAPVKLIVRDEDDNITVTGINETSDDIMFDCEYGYLSLTGKIRHTKKAAICLKRRSRAVVMNFKKTGGSDPAKGLYIARPINREDILPAILRECEFRKLATPDAELKISGFIRKGNDIAFKVNSNAYAHAVHFNLDDDIRLSDEYFDLLPGETRSITVYDAIEKLLVKDLVPQHVKNV